MILKYQDKHLVSYIDTDDKKFHHDVLLTRFLVRFFDLEDKKLHKNHYSSLGSMSNKENINSMIWKVEDFVYANGSTNSSFELLNINNPINDIQVANNILHRSNIIEIPYYNEDTRYAYIKQLAGI